MYIICLTGGYASGKSTAVQYLAGKGAQIIDADSLGHRAYEPGTPAFDQVLEVFGDAVRGSDGGIDRKALGRKVFGKPRAMDQLTAIVWPEIRRLAGAEIAAAGSRDPDGVVVLEAAVLLEAGWEDLGDEIWLLLVDREVAIERAIKRDGIDRQAVENRLDSQLTNEQRAARARLTRHKIIDNNGSPEAMTQVLDSAWDRFW